MATMYSSPDVSVEDCVLFFREISNTTISEEDFKKPDAKRWQALYGILLESMTGCEADLSAQTLQTRVRAASECDFSELHEESFSLMGFTMALQQKMYAAGIMDFTVRDLLEPRRARLIHVLSGAINFVKFRMHREEVFNLKKDDLEKKRESYDYVLKENAELKKKLQARRDAHQSHMMKMTQLQDENDAISIRLQEQHKQREVLQRTLSEMKSELSQKNAACDQVKVNILSAQAEGEKLSQCIVKSPERVRTDQGRAQNRIMALRTKSEEKHRRLQEVQRQKEAVVIQQQNADKAVRLFRDISNDSEKLGALEKEKQRQQEVHQDLRSMSLGLTAKVENLQLLQASQQEKLSKLDLQYHNKKASVQAQVSQLSQSKKKLDDPRSSSESKKCDLMMEKERILREVKEREDDMEANINRTNDLYFEILQQVDRLNVEAAEGLNKFKNIMKVDKGQMRKYDE